MSRLRMSFGVLATLLTASLFLLPSVKSAPKGGGPVPPGKIIYSYDGGVWQMNGDGSGKTVVAGPVDGVPSQGTYGADSHRWWIVMRDGEVWATPNGVDLLQVSDMHQRDNGDGTITVVLLNEGSGARPSWSNGGDSFLSVKGIHWVQDASLPVPPPDESQVSDVYLAIYRLDVSAAELEARFQLGLTGPAFDVTTAVPVVVEPFGYEENFTEHHWSPDGTKIAYLWRNNFEDLRDADLWVADVGPEMTLPVSALTDGVRVFDGGTGWIDFPQWSPAGAAEQRVAFRYYNGELRTVRPDGTGLTTVGIIGYGQIAWSPDGQYLAYRRSTHRGLDTVIYDIYRIPAAGGTSVQLTGDLNRELDKRVLGWGN